MVLLRHLLQDQDHRRLFARPAVRVRPGARPLPPRLRAQSRSRGRNHPGERRGGPVIGSARLPRYLDPNHPIPKLDKFAEADINAAAYFHRISGTVIYTRLGEIPSVQVLTTRVGYA